MRLLHFIPFLLALTPWSARADDGGYATYGVHNAPDASPCATRDCIYARASDDPTDPAYPPFWTSNWTMYRVFNNYAQFGPPYDGKPPSPLRPGQDYEISHGATYYDRTWSGPTGQGAMMEHYERRCLPIFPIANTFSCSFISLGEAAFFVTYERDRPKGMPPVCLFSSRNAAPETDFIKHLPYAKADGAKLDGRVQAYSFWVSGQDGQPVQTGVSPDRTADGDIMFGYAFESAARPDRADPQAPPYRHPQSFYFSGYPLPPATAPVVSQNYTGFAKVKPDPARTWGQVSTLDPSKLPACELFHPLMVRTTAARAILRTTAAREAPTWGDLGKTRR